MGGMNKPIQIFKTGKHTAMSGAALEFSESDLTASAKAYNPALHEAPIVIGHPRADAPAYGWVKSLSFADGLDAEPHQVDPQFAEMVSAGRFKKVSASFYTPDSPTNPVPGVYYLRHVGFLGAQPPAVKGLKQAEFGDADQGIVEFGDWDDQQNASLWRGMRDWLISKFGLDEADRALPNWGIQSLADSAAQSDPDADENVPISSFSETHQPTKGDEMSAEEKARLAALEEENRKLKQAQADFAEAEKKRKADTAHADHLSFAESLVKEGKLLPAHKGSAIAALDLIAAQDAPLEFGEGDAKGTLTADGFKQLLKSVPQAVNFKEVGGAGSGDAKTVDFALPTGFTVDPDRMATHQKAVEYQERNKCDYVTAVKAVETV